jgi:hypothetical protein
MPASQHVFALAVALAVAAAPASGGQFGFLKRDSKIAFQAFKDPNGRFTLDYPKDWQVIAGSGDVVVTFAAKNGEAALVVEHSRLKISLGPDDIDNTFAQIETDVLNERQPKATEVTARIDAVASARAIVIDYARPGLTRPERARQYSFPIGQELYRLACSTVTVQFPKYDSAFIRMAESFKTGAAKPGLLE